MAAARIVENPVLNSVDGIAGRVHRIPDHLQFGRRNVAGGIGKRGLRDPQVAARIKMGPVVGGIAGDDPVVVARIALRLRQRFQTSLRAPAGGNRRPEDKAVSLQAMRELRAAIAARQRSRTSRRTPSTTRTAKGGAYRPSRFFARNHPAACRGPHPDLDPRHRRDRRPDRRTRYISSVGWAARHAYQLRWLEERGTPGRPGSVRPSSA